MTQLRLALALAALLGLAASHTVVWWRSYDAGEAAAEARLAAQRQVVQDDLFRLGENLSRQAAEMERLKRERVDLVQSLEDAARSAPNADDPGVGPVGLSRVEQRWGSR